MAPSISLCELLEEEAVHKEKFVVLTHAGSFPYPPPLPGGRASVLEWIKPFSSGLSVSCSIVNLEESTVVKSC